MTTKKTLKIFKRKPGFNKKALYNTWLRDEAVTTTNSSGTTYESIKKRVLNMSRIVLVCHTLEPLIKQAYGYPDKSSSSSAENRKR